ncbi:MAG: hypothetical protein LBR41_02520 [Rickettsiales bacterium]|jgi:hypothetical protein|nr:hypothetical protein [Rickettsiales bacterium]
MKTKIIYISGGDKFSPEQIKIAIAEVRSALNLGDDTLVLGVPTDYQEPTTNHQPPTTNHQPPTTNHQPPATSPILSVLGGIKPIESEPTPGTPPPATDIDEELPAEKPEIRDISDMFDNLAPLEEEKIIDFKQCESGPTDVADADPTLEKLATEFAAVVETVPDEPATSHQSPTTTGKIGRLKNIFPLKPKKKSEPSMLDDLFGWAGVAANDDEFSMPDFFPRSGS